MDLETWREQRRISFDEIKLQQLQAKALIKPSLARKKWYTPFPKNLIKLASDKVRKNILTVGCGPGPEINKLKKLGLNITALDINPKTVIRANSHSKSNYLAADTLDLPFKNEYFDIVCMAGVATSLIGRNLNVAFMEYNRVLKSEGYLIISDFHVNSRNLTILERSLRDCLAIRELLGGMPQEVNKSLEHVFVVRPLGLPESRSIKLSPKTVTESLNSGMFERLAQHRQYDQFAIALIAWGFDIISHAFKPIRHNELLNIQILAQKKQTMTLSLY